MKEVKCFRCNKIITDKDQPEYSEELTEIFCNPDCATSYYFEEMGSVPLEGLMEFGRFNNLKYVNGNLIKTKSK